MSNPKQRYISNELVHFVGRGKTVDEQFQLLVHIINDGWILHYPFIPGVSGNLTVSAGAKISENQMYSPEITCFADIPPDDLALHMEKYSHMGLSFSKNFIADAGGSPVHYIPKNSAVKTGKPRPIQDFAQYRKANYDFFTALHMVNETIPKGEYFDKMLQEYRMLFSEMHKVIMENSKTPGVPPITARLMELQKFLDFHIFSYLKFFDHKKTDNDADNYYFEREWRVVGHVKFSLSDIKTVYIPSEYSERFRKNFPEYFGQVIFTDMA